MGVGGHPLGRITKNTVQTARRQAAGNSATAKGRNVVRGMDKGKGQGNLFMCNHSVLVFGYKVINFIWHCEICILSKCERLLV